MYSNACVNHLRLTVWAPCRGFKALKQSTKLLFLQLRRPQDALKTYTELLTYTKSAVTRNYAEKTINGILDYVGGGKGGPVDVETLEKFYQVTKKALQEAKNDVSPDGLLWWTLFEAYLIYVATISQDQLEASQALARPERIQSSATSTEDLSHVVQLVYVSRIIHFSSSVTCTSQQLPTGKTKRRKAHSSLRYMPSKFKCTTR